MAQTWKYAIGLGLVGAALATGCVVKSGGDGDIGDSGEGGTGGTSGGSGGSGGTTGGSSGKGGSGGSSGKGGAAGAATGGSSGKGGGAGTGGATGGSAGTGPAAGTGGSDGPTEQEKIPECDPGSGNLDNTPYPNCEPTDAADPDPCEVCIEANCCDESKACYGYAPGNVCGWGGPAEGEDYAGAGEIGCYVQCLADYVDEFQVCDEDGLNECTGKCQTVECGTVLGTQTSELAGCIHTSCNQECLGIESCE